VGGPHGEAEGRRAVAEGWARLIAQAFPSSDLSIRVQNPKAYRVFSSSDSKRENRLISFSGVPKMPISVLFYSPLLFRFIFSNLCSCTTMVPFFCDQNPAEYMRLRPRRNFFIANLRAPSHHFSEYFQPIPLPRRR